MGMTLYVQASPRGQESYSVRVADAFVSAYREKHPQEDVVGVNLFERELPPFDAAGAEGKMAIIYGKEGSERAKERWRQIEDVIAEFKSADRYVFAVPMWNFSLPYVLKHYIDLVTQPTHTFRVGPGGYEGLIRNRKALVVYASGGVYPEGHPMDHQKPYLRQALKFVGIDAQDEIHVSPTMGAPDVREVTLAKGIEQAKEIAARF